MFVYTREVNYHETDRMGVTHHSNYIKYLEEARVAYLDKINLGYDVFEANGIISPILKVSCEYKKFSTFKDKLSVEVTFSKYNGIRFNFNYVIKNEKGEVCCECSSEHCFIIDNKVVNLKRERPDFHEILQKEYEQN